MSNDPSNQPITALTEELQDLRFQRERDFLEDITNDTHGVIDEIHGDLSSDEENFLHTRGSRRDSQATPPRRNSLVWEWRLILQGYKCPLCGRKYLLASKSPFPAVTCYCGDHIIAKPNEQTLYLEWTPYGMDMLFPEDTPSEADGYDPSNYSDTTPLSELYDSDS